MDTFRKILKQKDKKDRKSDMVMNIEMPTDVKREIHVERTEDGLVGLPKEWQKLLPHMLTKEELSEGNNMKIAKNVLAWNEKHQQQGGQKTIKQVTSSSEFYVPTPPKNDNESSSAADHPDVDNDNNQEVSIDQQVSPNVETLKIEPNANTTSSPVPLRRKDTKKVGPRLQPNMTEDDVMNEIRDLCEIGHPLDKYDTDIELGAGAAGTVFLALNKETKERVAIKKIDMVKQQKKEMILMEIKVS